LLLAFLLCSVGEGIRASYEQGIALLALSRDMEVGGVNGESKEREGRGWVEAPGGVENASRKVPGPPFLEKRGIKAADFVPYP
jgi:hypothetical protein